MELNPHPLVARQVEQLRLVGDLGDDLTWMHVPRERCCCGRRGRGDEYLVGNRCNRCFCVCYGRGPARGVLLVRVIAFGAGTVLLGKATAMLEVGLGHWR